MNKILTPEKYGGLVLQRANQVDTRGLCAIIYGKAGTGKTTLVAQAQDSEEYGADLCILDSEAGVRSIDHRDDIYTPEITSWDQLDKFTKTVENDPNPPFKTFALDNMTDMQYLNIMKITGGRTPDWKDYNPSTTEMLIMARRWKDIARKKNVNVFFLAWDNVETDQSTQITRAELGFNKSLYQQFPGIVEIVCHITIANNPPFFTRVLNFAESPLSAAKIRRSKSDVAKSIPQRIPYGPDDSPLVDLLATLRGNVPFPADKYQMPKRKKEESES